MTGQQVFTLKVTGTFVIQASMGFTRVDLLPIADAVKIQIGGSAPITLENGNVKTPELVNLTLQSTYSLNSNGNAPLSNITIIPQGELALIGYM